MSGTGPSDAQRFAERFDPFHDPYLADPYPFFAEARAATPVFYSPDLDYWVVTRYHDIEQIFQTPKVFSAANTLAPLQPICPAAGRRLAEGGFRPVPTLTNSDPPGHTRVRRLAHVAFTSRRVAAMEPLVRELTGRSVEERLSSGGPTLFASWPGTCPRSSSSACSASLTRTLPASRPARRVACSSCGGDRMRTSRSGLYRGWRRSGVTPRRSSPAALSILVTILPAISSWHATATCQR